MTCPRCNCPDTRVSYTRSKVRPDAIYRRRRCQNPRCKATFRTCELLDPGDACRGRRPGEPRRVLGRPRKCPSLPDPTPPPVEIPSAPTSPDLPAESAPDELYPPEDWGDEFARAVRESQRELGVLGRGESNSISPAD